MQEAVIVSAVRTALGIFNGSLSSVGATRLGAEVIAAAVARADIRKDAVDEVIMGQVLPCGYGQNPARQATVQAGLPWEVNCLTVNKVCGSGLKAVMLAAQAVQLGDAQVVVAGGMENMSMAPYYLEKARFGYRLGAGSLQDHMVHDGLWDIVNDFHMGVSNELCSQKYGISRVDQDRYAAESYRRALTARDSGRFQDEIVPMPVPRPNGAELAFERDECPRETSYDILAGMPGAFQPDGVGTVGNASIVSDGAAAVVVMARSRAERLGCPVLATIGAQASFGLDMRYVLVAPIGAIPKVLRQQGLDTPAVDLFEINEAFSGSTVAVMRTLDLDPARVNVNGGSVALGHPIGASGCRVLVTLVHEMRRRDVRTGLATLCLGGGEAVALVVTR